MQLLTQLNNLNFNLVIESRTIVEPKSKIMKKQILLAAAFAMITAVSFGQQKDVQKREIKKEVEMTEDNGQKKLVIKTNDNNKVTEEVYVGEAADKKLKELEGKKPIGNVEKKVKMQRKMKVQQKKIN